MKAVIAILIIFSCVGPIDAMADERPASASSVKQEQPKDLDSSALPLNPADDPNLSFDDEASLGGGKVPVGSSRFFEHILQFSERYPSASSQ